jgi:hypothetical protein|tara:strand:+ start:1044 stop:1313 length:270 start_codon:yes stop_codon:yes gene_type:complete
MSKLILSIENGKIVSRLNGTGEGTVIATFVSCHQLLKIVKAHNKSEAKNTAVLSSSAIAKCITKFFPCKGQRARKKIVDEYLNLNNIGE